MKDTNKNLQTIKRLEDLASLADYTLLNRLKSDSEAREDGKDRSSREVCSGHYVPVKPTPLKNPQYVAHSRVFFKELGFADALAFSPDFIHMFTGDLSALPAPLCKIGWATGYALSIYGKEYYQQCPFGTGNGYGDGRAISVFEGVVNNKRWEMQLKGAGRTPYCRGADGRAVLRSSIREFLAQEHMHALGVPTSRSLTLYASYEERVRRPWFRANSRSMDPEVMIKEPTAITTRVASSFLRVGQLELFGRRARKGEHSKALQELEQIVLYAIEREYSEVVEESWSLNQKVLAFAREFGLRLASLVANWIRVGYCQGNFNSDNTAIGGFTLDYGPFGFIDMFDPKYQPWTGGGMHFSFLNQPQAAQRNFYSFCTALAPLLASDANALSELDKILKGFSQVMQEAMENMWAAKLGLKSFDAPLFQELAALMVQTSVDYTIFFRELSLIPKDTAPLHKSFYKDISSDDATMERWSQWLQKWRAKIDTHSLEAQERLSCKMKSINPKYILREWHLVPAYEQAAKQEYALLHELQEVMSHPYDEQSKEIEEKYYRLKPPELFGAAGISHVSCSS